MIRPKLRNPVLGLLVVLASAALAATGFLSDAPNRLADGVSLPIWRAPVGLVVIIGSLICGLAMLSLARGRWADRLALILALLLVFALPIAAGLFAKALAVPDHPAQRQALGPAFWIACLSAGLAALDAMQRLKLAALTRGLGGLAMIGAAYGLARAGVFDALSLSREFASQGPRFAAELLRHVLLVLGALAGAVLLCGPLVALVRRGGRARGLLFAVLGLLQTVPSIALFGLLIAPLNALARQVPALKAIGISGLGATPAIIALVLYSAFPLVRMSDAALAAVPAEVAEAARGLGFGRWRRFFSVDMPLALPVLVSGLRVVTLQAIGLATVAALIGAGGLGTFIFEGIGEYALDLVLVGALPVILLALAADLLFGALLALVEVPR